MLYDKNFLFYIKRYISHMAETRRDRGQSTSVMMKMSHYVGFGS